MSANPIRVATAALSKRIYAGRAAADGMSLKEPRTDVTSDAIKAVIEHIGIGRQTDVRCDGEVICTIAVYPPGRVSSHHQDRSATGSEANQQPGQRSEPESLPDLATFGKVGA